jgi:hypothetical protein
VALTLASRVGDVAAAYPETIPVFLRFGFSMITNPLMRQTVARSSLWSRFAGCGESTPINSWQHSAASQKREAAQQTASPIG